MSLSAVKKPKIENYLDYRDYLTHYYEWRKAKSHFSYQIWADELSLNSKGYLRLVIAGKRSITDDLFLRMTNLIGLKKSEIEYFENLIKFNQAKDFEMRTHFFSKLQKNKKFSQKWIVNSYDYLADEWCPRVHVLLGQDGLEKTVEAFAQNLGISQVKVSQIFSRLQDLGYAEVVNGQWYSKDVINSIPDKIGDLALQSFHKKSLEKAITSIDDDPHTRHFNATYFIIPKDDLCKIRAEINEFSQKLLQKYGELKIDEHKKHQLYQVNINAIPMSGELIHSDLNEETKCAQSSGRIENNCEVSL